MKSCPNNIVNISWQIYIIRNLKKLFEIPFHHVSFAITYFSIYTFHSHSAHTSQTLPTTPVTLSFSLIIPLSLLSGLVWISKAFLFFIFYLPTSLSYNKSKIKFKTSLPLFLSLSAPFKDVNYRKSARAPWGKEQPLKNLHRIYRKFLNLNIHYFAISSRGTKKSQLRRARRRKANIARKRTKMCPYYGFFLVKLAFLRTARRIYAGSNLRNCESSQLKMLFINFLLYPLKLIFFDHNYPCY